MDKKLMKIINKLTDKELDIIVNYWMKKNNKGKSDKKDIIVHFKKLCDELEISSIEIKKPSRKHPTVFYRHKIAYLLHRNLKYSSTQVANILNRNHATVLSSCKVIEDMMTYDAELKTEIIQLIEILKNEKQ